MDWKIQSIFPSEDDFGTDPYGYRVLLGDKLMAEYGDDYHDKGSDKSVGYIDGYCDGINVTLQSHWITYEEIVDKTI